MITIHLVSIVLEAVIVLLALALAISKKRAAGWGLALTFAIYVFYDAAKYYYWGLSGSILDLIFFLATVSALISIYSIYKHAKL